MADTTYTVEIPISVQDNSKVGLVAAQTRLTAFEASLKRTQTQLAKLNGTTGGPKLTASDEATSKMAMVMEGAKKLAAIGVQIPLTVLDKASTAIAGIIGGIASTAGHLLDTLTSPLALLGGSAGLAGLTVWPIGLAANLEQAQIGFENLFGSAGKAKSFISDLQQFSTQVPHRLTELLDLSQTLAAAGIPADDLIPKLSKIADLAALTKSPKDAIVSFTAAFADMHKHVFLTGETLARMNDYLPISQMLADHFGMTLAQFNQKMEQGNTVLSSLAESAIIDVLGRKYPDAAEKANHSFTGLLTTLQDVFSVDLATPWGAGLMGVVEPRLQALVTWVGKNGDQIKVWRDEIQKAGDTVAHFVFDRLDIMGERLLKLTSGLDFKNATPGQQLTMLWHNLIVAPFDEWWGGPGKQWATKAAGDIGGTLGSVVGGIFWTALGADSSRAGDVGSAVGSSFLSHFLAALAPSADSPLASWANLWKWMTTATPATGPIGIGQGIGSSIIAPGQVPGQTNPAPVRDPTTGLVVPAASRSGSRPGGMSNTYMLPGGGNGGFPAPGDIAGWRAVLTQQAGALGADPDFINAVLAGAYAESGLDPNRRQAGGNGRGFFQFDTGGGMGTGLSDAQLYSEAYQASKILPEYARAWRNAPSNLTGADRAAWVASHAERPYDYENPNSQASANYRAGYSTVTSVPGTASTAPVTMAAGAVVIQVQSLPDDPLAIDRFAATIADPIANHLAKKLEQAQSNTAPTR